MPPLREEEGFSAFERAVLARLDRIATALEALAPTTAADPLIVALRAKFGTSAFTAAEAIAVAENERRQADAAGLRLTDLPHELERARISNPHALGRLLANLEGDGISRAGQERGSVLWSVEVSRGVETAKRIPRIRRTG